MPAQVRRAVYERDGARCAHIDTEGRRCTEQGQLEIDHIVPWALGGPSTVDNLRLACRGHNAQAARQAFGAAFIDGRIERRREAQRVASEERRPDDGRWLGGPESVLFWGEVGLCLLLPMGLFAVPRVRRNRHALFFASLLTVMGFVVNRLNVSITGMVGSSGVTYVPSLFEAAVTLSMVAGGFLAFALAVRYLNVFPKHEMKHARRSTM